MVFDPDLSAIWVISEFDDLITQMTLEGRIVKSCHGPRNPAQQGLGGITKVGTMLYIAEVSDTDIFQPPDVPGTIFIVDPSTLVCEPCPPVTGGDEDGDGVCGDADNCRVDPNPSQSDADGDGVGDACDSPTGDDADQDGIPDAQDECPESILDPTVIIPPVAGPPSHHGTACSTGVPNTLLADGCTIADKIDACDAATQTKHQFEACTQRLLGRLRRQHVIDERQRKAIERCIRRSVKRDRRHHGH
jgi:hypothetical protein